MCYLVARTAEATAANPTIPTAAAQPMAPAWLPNSYSFTHVLPSSCSFSFPAPSLLLLLLPPLLLASPTAPPPPPPGGLEDGLCPVQLQTWMSPRQLQTWMSQRMDGLCPAQLQTWMSQRKLSV